MALSEQQQITDLYNRLTALNSDLQQFCSTSRVITIENSLSASLSTILKSLTSAEEAIKQIQLDLADALSDLRSL